MPDKTFDVAIIGFGFSGLMVLSHLIERTLQPLSIGIFDASQDASFGPAYATKRLEHLLNVRAGRMSAYADKPSDFFDWCISGLGQQAAHEIGYDQEITPDTFAPRALYNAYLQAIKTCILAQAKEKQVSIDHIRKNVMSLDIPYLSVGDQQFFAEHIVVASGYDFAKKFTGNVIREPWHFDFERLRGSKDTVALIGTGLTAVDTMVSLIGVRFQGSIIAISRHALFPEPHSNSHITTELPPLPAKTTLANICAFIRKSSAEHDWRHVLDTLRPNTVAIWKKLSPSSQTLFFRRYFSLWNRYRHRMAPEIHAVLQEARASGQLIGKNGRVIGATEQGVEIEDGKKREFISSPYVFDCTGPSYGALPTYLQPLIQQNKIKLHASGVGLAANDVGNISTDQASIYAIGSLLLGERLETTAVPELREQAETIAKAILKL